MPVEKYLSKLPFKTIGKVTPGCRYIVVTWTKGNAKKRQVASCHHKVDEARKSLKMVREYYKKSWQRMVPGAKFIFSEQRAAIFDIKSGKKVISKLKTKGK